MATALERALALQAAAAPGRSSQAAAAPGRSSEAPLPPLPVLVLGPAGSGRTSLLLRTALAGGADGLRTLFLAPSAIPRLPGGPGGTGIDPRALQLLELRYPRSRLSLSHELVALAPHPPALLLLDGLEHYLGMSPSVPARLAALLLEVTRCPPGRRPPQLVAALRLPPPAPHVLGTLLRYFPARCHLRPSPESPCHLRVTLRCPGTAPRRWRLRLGDGDSDRGGDSDSDSDSGEGDSEEEWV